MAPRLSINRTRLWDRIHEMAAIGATQNGGCNRQALSDEDKKGRDLFCTWALNAGCSIRVDQLGNIFARRKGSSAMAPPVLSGSHLDTQPTGGKFDGVYGVLAALEVIETLNDLDIRTYHAVEAVVWTNEEGARFSPPMIGSGVFSGAFSVAYAYGRMDKQGKSIEGELNRINYAGCATCASFPIKAAFEVHIEQGPVLEETEKTIGIVTGVQGIRWFDVTISGRAVHAGPTPMALRSDPMNALYRVVERIYAIAEMSAPDSRATLGDICVSPGARNTVPQVVKLSVDLRHPDEARLEEMEAELRKAAADAGLAARVQVAVTTIWRSPAVKFDTSCIDAVRRAAEHLNLSHSELVSGAGHDSVYLSRVAPTSMIFIPCRDGISHNEAEYASADHLEAGANVLLAAILDQAKQC